MLGGNMARRRPFRLLLLALVALSLVAAACGRGDDSNSSAAPTTTSPPANSGSATTIADKCASESLQATEVGVTADTITIFVMADVGSPLAPGLFQGSIDAVKAWGEAMNKQGGVGCRKVVVRDWDSKLTPDDTTNGTIDACKNAFAMVGTTSLFVLDPSNLANCPDKAGKPTGVPDIAQLATEIPHQCNPTTYPINGYKADCPYTGGVRNTTQFVGAYRYYLSQVPDLHGIFLIPGDLPSAIQSSILGVRAGESIGVKNDGEFKVSGRDEQAAFARFTQPVKEKASTLVYNGSNDVAMVKMRKEAKAQGVDTVKVWACQLSCYTPSFLQAGGADVEGTYAWMQFLPYEEADTNAELEAYLDAVGGVGKATSWGAAAWAGAVEFKQVIDGIVEKDGPNAITRERFLKDLAALDDFDANGWFGKKGQRELSDCFVLLQVQSGKFVRVFPKERGTFDCNPQNLQEVAVDPTTAFKG
jgi:hypothetical protein